MKRGIIEHILTSNIMYPTADMDHRMREYYYHRFRFSVDLSKVTKTTTQPNRPQVSHSLTLRVCTCM